MFFVALLQVYCVVSKEILPKCGENGPISGRRRKNAESCHVSGCHGFIGPDFSTLFHTFSHFSLKIKAFLEIKRKRPNHFAR